MESVRAEDFARLRWQAMRLYNIETSKSWFFPDFV
jgi:hypothetical protein